MDLPTVDNLDIQIKSSADSAAKSVERLANSVGNLAMKLNAIRGGGMRDFSSGLRSLSDAAKGINASKLTTIAKGIEKLSKIDSAQLRSVGNATQALSTGLRTLGSIPKINVDSVSKAIGELSKHDSSKLSALGTTLQPLASGINALSSVQNMSDITQTISSLRQLSTIDMSKFNSGALNSLSASLSGFVSTMNGAGNISGNISNLINSLGRLGSVGGNFSVISSDLPALSTSLRNFIQSMSGAGSVSKDTMSLVSALGQLGNAGGKIKSAADNLDNLADKLKDFMQTMQNAPQVSQNTISLINALGRLNGASVNLGNSMGGSGASKGASMFANGLKTVGSWLGNGVKRILTFNGALNRFIPGMKKAENSTKGFVSKIGMFYAKFFLLIRAFKTLGKVVEDAMDSIEVVNYFNAAVDQVTSHADLSKWQEMGYDSAESYANSFKEGMLKTTEQMSGYTLNAAGNLVQSGMKNFGIDSSMLMNAQAQFAQMASSIGVSSDYSTKISRAMTEIGADLASVKNMDFEDVWENLSSGLTGKQLLTA